MKTRGCGDAERSAVPQIAKSGLGRRELVERRPLGRWRPTVGGAQVLLVQQAAKWRWMTSNRRLRSIGLVA